MICFINGIQTPNVVSLSKVLYTRFTVLVICLLYTSAGEKSFFANQTERDVLLL